MNATIRSFCFMFCLLSLTSCWHKTPKTTIVETNEITDVYHFIEPREYNKDTLVIFDIDNTLATTPTDLGSDHWVNALYRQKQEAGLSDFDTLYEVLPLYNQIQMLTWLVPVTEESVPLVQSLQDKGITVIALTARDLFVFYRTREQLDRIGIDFSRTSPKKHFNPYGQPRPIFYEEGIIYANNHNKGPVLINWLKQMGYHPKKIIFIDDKLKNVKAVENTVIKAGYPFVGIRYGYMDERVKNIDLQQTEREYQQLLEANPDRPVLPFKTISPTPTT